MRAEWPSRATRDETRMRLLPVVRKLLGLPHAQVEANLEALVRTGGAAATIEWSADVDDAALARAAAHLHDKGAFFDAAEVLFRVPRAVGRRDRGYSGECVECLLSAC